MLAGIPCERQPSGLSDQDLKEIDGIIAFGSQVALTFGVGLPWAVKNRMWYPPHLGFKPIAVLLTNSLHRISPSPVPFFISSSVL